MTEFLKKFTVILLLLSLLSSVFSLSLLSASADSSSQITVSFDACGGTCRKASVNVTPGGFYGTLPTPSRTGYKFIAWYSAQSGGTEVTRKTVVTDSEDHTIYARWSPYTYIVTFDADGGECETQSETVTFGEAYGVLPVPEKSGYVFLGWYDSSDNQIINESIVSIPSNHTLTAKWTDSTITDVVMTSLPDRLEYSFGESPDFSGFTLTASYDNGETSIITSGFDYSPEVFDESGTVKVNVFYLDRTFSFDVTVDRGSCIKTEIDSLPDKLSYIVGESFDVTGMSMLLTYEDGSSEVVTDGIKYDGDAFEREGTYRIPVTFDGITYYINGVTVTDKEIESLKIEDAGIPEYADQGVIDKDNIIVRAYFTDGTDAVITDFTYVVDGDEANNSNILSVGGHSLKIQYKDKSKTIYFSLSTAPDGSDAEILFSSVSVNEDEEFSLPLTIYGNTGFTGLYLEISYDSSVVEPSDELAETGALFENMSGYGFAVNVKNDGLLAVSVYGLGSEITDNGELLILHLKALSAGSAYLNFSGYFFDEDYNESEIESSRGTPNEISVNRADTPLFTFGETTVSGNILSVPLMLSSSTDISSFIDVITYDSSLLTYESFNSGLSGLNAASDTGTVTISSDESFETAGGEVQIGTLMFIIADEASGETEISFISAVYTGTDDSSTKSARTRNLTVEVGVVKDYSIELSMNSCSMVAGQSGNLCIESYNNCGVSSMTLEVIYDPDLVEITGVSSEDATSDGLFNYNITSGRLLITWSSTEDIDDNGAFFIIGMKAKRTFSDVLFELNCLDMYCENGTEPEVTITSGKCSFSTSKTIVAPTCTEYGIIRYYCKSCGNTQTKMVAPLGHNYKTVTTTDDEGNEKTETLCANCGKTRQSVSTKSGVKTITIDKFINNLIDRLYKKSEYYFIAKILYIILSGSIK